MEAAAILIISILGLTLLVVAVVSVFSNLDKFPTLEKQIILNRLTKEERKELKNRYRQGRPNSIQPIKTVQKYKYPEATKRYKERMEELRKAEQEKEDKNKTYKGKRGGRYTKDVTKDGRPYRRYF
tara:strand:+ start:218 stop:595 length:378 start_codon:yes stop_codon:yes gene_type:complete